METKGNNDTKVEASKHSVLLDGCISGHSFSKMQDIGESQLIIIIKNGVHCIWDLPRY